MIIWRDLKNLLWVLLSFIIGYSLDDSLAHADDQNVLIRQLLSKGVESESPITRARIYMKSISDEDAVQIIDLLKQIPTLTDLEFHHLKISDASLSRIEALTSVTSVFFEDVPVGDATCKAILKLEKVEEISLTACSLQESQLNLLCDKPNLRYLHISGDKRLRSGDFAPLSKLRSVETLLIRDVDIKDDDLLGLVNLPLLNHLHVNKTKITDHVFPILVKIPRLKYVNLASTKVTDAAVKGFREAHPNVHIRTATEH